VSYFAGWVKYRRGIIEHVLDGRLTGHEHYALSQLILLADAGTGGDRINAPLLCYYTGHVFNQDTAQKILNSLHSNGYIWYHGKVFSTIPQPYWVNRYKLTQGPMKERMTRIDELLGESTISLADIWKAAVETTDGNAVETTDETTDNYKKREERKDTKKQSTISNRESASVCDSASASKHRSMQRTKGAGACASLRDSLKPSLSASRIQYTATDTSTPTAPSTDSLAWVRADGARRL
jgi:hypothetical protein